MINTNQVPRWLIVNEHTTIMNSAYTTTAKKNTVSRATPPRPVCSARLDTRVPNGEATWTFTRHSKTRVQAQRKKAKKIVYAHHVIPARLLIELQSSRYQFCNALTTRYFLLSHPTVMNTCTYHSSTNSKNTTQHSSTTRTTHHAPRTIYTGIK